MGKFDEAERIYREMDRRDLALQLRANLGDWFKVVNLVQQGGGDDETLAQSWNQIGDYYMEHQMMAKAAMHYAQAKNTKALIDQLHNAFAVADRQLHDGQASGEVKKSAVAGIIRASSVAE